MSEIWVWILLINISQIRASFDFKLGYCRMAYESPCEKPQDNENPSGEHVEINGFYWRDFYGKIPTDAFPLGNSNQNPQTYVGMVYEPLKNGTFVVTIVDGLDYVYVVQDGEVFKRTNHIQILCTLEPETLVWFKLTSSNFKTQKGYKTVIGNYHLAFDANGRPNAYTHYITKATKCQVNYAGSNSAFGDTMEYALLDGSPAKETNVLWLMFKDEYEEKSVVETKKKGQSFVSHYYEYKIRPDSVIPSFYKQINIGSFSLTCTNEGSNRNELEKDVRSLSSMAYYWKPDMVFERNEIMEIGQDYFGTKLVLGQSYVSDLNIYSVGEVSLDDPSHVIMPYIRSNVLETIYYQVLSSKQPELFEWINATTETFLQLNQSRMISAGQMYNQTEIYVGREVYKTTITPGGIRVFDTAAYCFTQYGPVENFQVLMFKDPEKSSAN